MAKLSEVTGAQPPQKLKLSQVSKPKPDFSGVTGSFRGEKSLARRAAENLAGESGANALDALQHHSMNALHGGAQLIEHGLSNMADRYLDADNPIRRSLNSAVAQDDAAIKAREREYQARVPDGKAALGGAAVGELAPWAVASRSLRAAGLAPKLARVSEVPGLLGKAGNVAAKTGLLAGEGAIMGALSPVTEEGDYASQKGSQVVLGAVTAPLMAAGVTGIGGLVGSARGLARYLTPGGRDIIADQRIAKMFGSDPATLATLQQGSRVPGFQPTPAQALGTPEAVQAERILRNNGQTAPAFAARESANNAALRDVVAGVAGTDADAAAARAARKAATDPYYAQLAGQRVDASTVLQALDGLNNSSMGVRPNIKSAAASLRAEIMARTGPDGKIDAGILSGLHENAGSHLGPMASAQEKKALGPIKDSIADALDSAVPGYRANLAAYGAASQPLTDMAAGRTALGAIDSGGRDAGGNPIVNLAAIRSLLAKDAKAKYRMSPQARAQLEAVLEAAQQRSITNNTVSATGPGTAADAMRGAASSPVVQRLAGHGVSALGGALGGLPGYALGAGLTEAAVGANNAVLRRVGQKASSAEETAKAIEAVLKRKQKPRGLLQMPQYLLPYQTK